MSAKIYPKIRPGESEENFLKRQKRAEKIIKTHKKYDAEWKAMPEEVATGCKCATCGLSIATGACCACGSGICCTISGGKRKKKRKSRRRKKKSKRKKTKRKKKRKTRRRKKRKRKKTRKKRRR